MANNENLPPSMRGSDSQQAVPPSMRTESLPPSMRGGGSSFIDRIISPIKQAVTAPASIAQKMSPGVEEYAHFASLVMPEIYKSSPQAKAWNAAKTLETKSREGLNALVDMIPEAQTGSVAANIAINTPKTAGKVLADFAPTFISPEVVALEGAGPAALGALKTKPVVNAAKWAWQSTPESVRKLLVYRFGQPGAYGKLAEAAQLNKQLGGDEAATIGKALNPKNLSAAEKVRMGQIVEGSLSVSERELGLRLRASYAREAINSLENKAKELGLLPETTLNQLSKGQRAVVRNNIAAINQRIEQLKNHGQSTRDALVAKANNLKIQGASGVVRSVESAEGAVGKLDELIQSTRDVLTGNQFEGLEGLMAQDALRRTATQTKLLSRFEKSSIGEQEKLFGRLAVAAKRAGVKIENIYEKEISVGNFKGLLSAIQNSSTNFPMKRKLINQLTIARDEAQKKLADSYRVSGKKYMSRLYLPNEVPGEDKVFGFMNNRIKGDRFKGRKDIAEGARIEMGQIKQPAYPVAKSLAQVTDAVENARLFRSVAENPAWSTADEAIATQKGMVKLPKSNTLGDLSGKYVDKYIADDINHLTTAKGAAQKMYEQGLSLWKYGKVVLNPATHFRNMMSNAILMDLGGIDLLRQPMAISRGAKEYANKGASYWEAKKAGLLGNEFFGAEIKRFRDELVATNPDATIWNKMLDVSKKIGNKAGDTYAAEEQLFKLTKFMENRRLGMGVEEAVKDAEGWLFNYAKVPKAIDVLRKSPLGAPFVTFVYKAMPKVAQSALERPLSVYKYHALFNSMEHVAKENLGYSDEDINKIKRNARGQIAILPFKDKSGNPMILDLSYVLPWGDVGEMGGFAGLPPSVVMGGPLKTVIELGMNKSMYRDSEIWKGTDTTEVKAAKMTDYFLKAMLPTLTPGVGGDRSLFRGGYSYEKVRAATQNKPTYPFNEQRYMAQTIADTVFGIKIKPAELDKIKIDAVMDAGRNEMEANATMTYKLRHKGLDDADKLKAKSDFEGTLDRIRKELKHRLGK